jgi:plasmid stability protein
MVRTQIQLTAAQFEQLKLRAAADGISMAAEIRRALDSHLKQGNEDPARNRAVASIGGFRSGRADVSIKHDDHLAEAFGD